VTGVAGWRRQGPEPEHDGVGLGAEPLGHRIQRPPMDALGADAVHNVAHLLPADLHAQNDAAASRKRRRYNRAIS